jgi:hypothetical protein
MTPRLFYISFWEWVKSFINYEHNKTYNNSSIGFIKIKIIIQSSTPINAKLIKMEDMPL